MEKVLESYSICCEAIKVKNQNKSKKKGEKAHECTYVCGGGEEDGDEDKS